MPDIKEVRSQIKNLSHLDIMDKLTGFREINELPNILEDSEVIENLAQGYYSGGNGIVVATNKRVIFLNKKLFGKLIIEDFQYNAISKIQYTNALVFRKIILYTSNQKVKIGEVERSHAKNFVDFVENKMASLAQNETKNSSKELKTNDTSDTLSKLERLAKLKEAGALTDEEFNTQKDKILNS